MLKIDWILSDQVTNQLIKVNNPVIDDVGEVDFIFSDKTGTLTKNKLNFKEMSIINKQDQI